MKTGEFRGANSFDDLAKGSRLPGNCVVNFLPPGHLDGQKQPRVWTEFVDAFAQLYAVRVQKNVAPGLVQRASDAPDYRMLQRLVAANPQNRRGNLRHSVRRNFHFRCVGIGLRFDFVLIGRRKYSRREMKDRCAVAAAGESARRPTAKKIQTQSEGKLHTRPKNRCAAGTLPGGI